MAKLSKLRTGAGRLVLGLFLLGAVLVLIFMIRTVNDRETWPTAEGTVLERTSSGRSTSVVVTYPGPNGPETATVGEAGSAHHVGERVLVRYEVTDGRVSDVALDDAGQAHVVVIVMAGIAAVSGAFLTLVAWSRPRD